MGDKGQKRRYHFIVNPKARSGMGEMVWRRLEPELKKRRIDYQRHLTRKRRHAEEIARDITSDGREHTLIVLGGDGTVNEVVNGVRDIEKVTLGYIPIGSSNDFARGLKLEQEPEKALEHMISAETIREVDIGVLSRAGGQRRFIVSAGIGFDAAVCHEVCVSRLKLFLNQIGLGKLCYAAIAFERLRKDRTVCMEMILPGGEKKIYKKTYFAAFMNLPYEGGGFKFTPEAVEDDGLLDVIVLYDVPVLKILFLLPLAFMGKHTRFRGVAMHRCRQVQVHAEKALPLHTDGEPGFLRKDVSAEVLDKKMKIIIS